MASSTRSARRSGPSDGSDPAPCPPAAAGIPTAANTAPHTSKPRMPTTFWTPRHGLVLHHEFTAAAIAAAVNSWWRTSPWRGVQKVVGMRGLLVCGAVLAAVGMPAAAGGQGAGSDPSLGPDRRADLVLDAMTLQEKAELMSNDTG